MVKIDDGSLISDLSVSEQTGSRVYKLCICKWTETLFHYNILKLKTASAIDFAWEDQELEFRITLYFLLNYWHCKYNYISLKCQKTSA